MVVKSQCNGNRITGLYVGVDNVRRYFPRNMGAIELQLDHLQIRCGLAPHFWEDRPEIRDPRLCEWLESKQSHGKGCRTPMPLSLIPSGNDSFILGPAALNSRSRVRAPGRESAPAHNQSGYSAE